LKQFEYLEILDFNEFPSFDINHLHHLQALIMRGSKTGIEDFNNLTQLRYLTYCGKRCEMSSLNMFTNLTSLNIPHTAIPPKGIKNLTNLVHINISGNRGKYNLNNMPKLKHISMYGCDFGNKNINKLVNVESLYCGRTGITDISHMIKLRRLDCSNTEITQSSINNLQGLTFLECKNNPNIVSVNHLQYLRSLTISSGSVVGQQGITGLSHLTYLDCSCNKQIHDLGHLPSLGKLRASETDIKQEGISKLTNLIMLDIQGNSGVKDVHHMTRLTELDIRETEVSNEGIAGLNLTVLKFSKNIRDLSHMSNLKILWADDSGITQDTIVGISHCRLFELHCVNCPITSIDQLKSLVVADISGTLIKSVRSLKLRILICDDIDIRVECPKLRSLTSDTISQENIMNLSSLRYLKCNKNKKINDVNHLTRLINLRAKDSSITPEGVAKLKFCFVYGVNHF
jgi:Leucine-rich repeat (LRR) protein